MQYNDEEFETEKDEYMLYNVQQQKLRSYAPQQYPVANSSKQVIKINLHVEPAKQFMPPKNRKINGVRLSRDNKVLGGFNNFQKDFESSNLYSVQKQDQNTYKLRMSEDSNSMRQSQWFYFSVKGLKSANFIVSGFQKSDSLFNHGMKICVNQNGTWKRGGQNIQYVQQTETQSYCLKFSYQFNNPSNKVYFAYCYPYTFCDLQIFIMRLERLKLEFLKCQQFAKSYLQHAIYLVSIGNFQSKDIILLTARVHPGQTVSSFIIQGVIEFLIGNSRQAELLRQRYLFKIFPMLNPDGVILGNYRFSYTGYDLNRKWKQTNQKLHPQIFYIKKFLTQGLKDKKVSMVIDIHGHSRQKNLFFYGCHDRNQGSPAAKQFPFVMSRLDPNFSYHNSSFSLQKSKQGTQRISLYNLLRIPHVYTLQCSFCGNQESNENFTIQNLKQFGVKLCQGIAIYFSEDAPKKYKNLALVSKLIKQKKKVIKDFYMNKDYVEYGMQEEETGSESAPSQGCYREEQIKKILKIQEKDKTKPKSFQMRLRPQTCKATQKKSTIQNPVWNTSAQCKIRTINGSLFDKKNEKDKYRQYFRPQQMNITFDPETLKTAEKQEQNQQGVDNKNRFSNVREELATKNSQYRRIKQYGEILMKHQKFKASNTASIKKQENRNYERKSSFAFQITGQPEPVMLQINKASFTLQCQTTAVITRKRRSDYGIVPGYFNFSNYSIRAKDYIEQKRQMRPVSYCKKLIMKQ